LSSTKRRRRAAVAPSSRRRRAAVAPPSRRRREVFVDPLDGTREFVEGRLTNVMSLVGIACGGRAVAGAVGLPFDADDAAAAAAPAPSAVVYGDAASDTR